MGLKPDNVVLRATWNPARQIQRTDLGHLRVGAPADIAVLRVEHGRFGFVDVYGGKLTGTERLSCEATLRDGQVVYDLNGLTRVEWTTLPKDYPKQTGEWDAVIQPPSGKH